MDRVTYRKSIKEDIPKINNLFIEMVKTVNERMIREGIEAYPDFENGYEEGYLDNFYIDDNRVIYVALDNDNIIGFISIESYPDNDYIYLDDYSVSKDYRGKGIGSKLINMSFDFAKEKGISQIITHVENANKESIDFYLKKGFIIIKEEGHRLLIKKESK